MRSFFRLPACDIRASPAHIAAGNFQGRRARIRQWVRGQPSSTYAYTVDASDGWGNRSMPSAPRTVAIPVDPGPWLVAAAGDIACDPTDAAFNGGAGTSTKCRQRATSDVLSSIGPDAVLALGDNQYECGGFSAFAQSYDVSWRRLKTLTYPVAGTTNT
jgi:hypothetical protein